MPTPIPRLSDGDRGRHKAELPPTTLRSTPYLVHVELLRTHPSAMVLQVPYITSPSSSAMGIIRRSPDEEYFAAGPFTSIPGGVMQQDEAL